MRLLSRQLSPVPCRLKTSDMSTKPKQDRRIIRTVDRLLGAIDRTVRAAEQVKQARQDLAKLSKSFQLERRDQSTKEVEQA